MVGVRTLPFLRYRCPVVPGLLHGRPPDRPADRRGGDAGAAGRGHGRGGIRAGLDGPPDRHVQLAGAGARLRPGRDRPGHHLHRPGLGGAFGGGAGPRRDGRRPDEHAAPGRYRRRRGRARRPLRLPRHHRDPARPGGPARPSWRRPPAGRRRRLRRRHPGSRRGAARRPCRGHPRRPRRHRQRA